MVDARDDIGVHAGPLRTVDADVLGVPLFENDPTDALASLNAATAGEIQRARTSRECTGELYEIFLAPVSIEGWRVRRIALIGAGRRERFTTDRLRKVAAAVCLDARRRHVARLAMLVRGDASVATGVQAVAEGLTLSEFDVGTYKSERRLGPAPALQVVLEDAVEGDMRPAARRGRVLGTSSNLARALGNEPSNVLTPTAFADRARELARETGLEAEVLEESALESLGMGLLLGVARGSAEPPRVIVLRHDPPGAPRAPVLGLVGKGVTFDTGGISLKPADGMERMKDDMAGGAAVVCAMRAIAVLDAPMRVVGVVPATENMPGGRAIKPGDVLKSADGKTIEVINTDAEGRLILGDALWYIRQQGATHVIDVATLTGACVVALGKVASGLFGTPEWWVEHVRDVAADAGDRAWAMPLDEEYREQLRSEVADLSNSGGRPAGAITAAMFLKEFAGNQPWVHMDIAGTAWLDDVKPWMLKGPTGVAVRTMAEVALRGVPPRSD